MIRPLAPDILQSYEFLADIDFIRAKALFAEQVKAIKPIVEDSEQMDWYVPCIRSYSCLYRNRVSR